MSKLDESLEMLIKIKGRKDFLDNIKHALKNVESDRVSTSVKCEKNTLSIYIKASDFNILLAVNNSIMQFLKMITEVNKYE